MTCLSAAILKLKKTDQKYSIVKVKAADDKTKDYEKKLLAAILGGGEEVKLDDIHIDSKMSEIKDILYQEMVAKKYFDQNPSKIKSHYFGYGIGLMMLGGLFFWLSYNLILAIGLSGLILIIFAKFMPKKTREGVIAKEKALGLKEFLYRADRYKLKWQEKQDVFEKFLPHAMVFGIAGRWAGNFKNIYQDQTPSSWYSGNFATFNAVIFANEMSHFSSAASTSYSPPAASGGSGFGGGSSGGGFGGGGGESW